MTPVSNTHSLSHTHVKYTQVFSLVCNWVNLVFSEELSDYNSLNVPLHNRRHQVSDCTVIRWLSGDWQSSTNFLFLLCAAEGSWRGGSGTGLRAESGVGPAELSLLHRTESPHLPARLVHRSHLTRQPEGTNTWPHDLMGWIKSQLITDFINLWHSDHVALSTAWQKKTSQSVFSFYVNCGVDWNN